MAEPSQGWLTSRRVLSRPAIWGKLPGHADFVQHRVRHGEGAGWRAWLEREQVLGQAHAQRATRIPIAFILPPGTLPFARRQFVLGAVRASHDKVGRPCPAIVYQLAHPRWVRTYLAWQAQHPGPQLDWLFLLSRLLAAPPAGDDASQRVERLSRAVDMLWRHVAPDIWTALLAGRLRAHVAHMAVAATPERLADREPASADLHGVHHLPWADWPRRLLQSPRRAAFWQQDAAGRFIDASEHLKPLWSGAP